IARLGVMTPEEARSEALILLADVARGGDPADDRASNRKALTVEQLCREYVDRCEKGLLLTRRGLPKKPYTLYVDRGRLERHVIPLLGNRPIKDVTPADIRKLMRDVTAGRTAITEKTQAKRGRAIVRGGAGAAARLVGLLGAVFQYAVDDG